MKLIYTCDGLYGWNLNGKIIWCTNKQELYSIGWAHVAPRKDEEEKQSFIKDVDYAIDHCAKTGDSIAEFGVFGTFMYTTTEPEYEF